MEINYPLLLDGGLSNQLAVQGIDLKNPLWSAKALLDDPKKIVAAHRAYLDAGADCIITSSYQASVDGFMAIGLSKEKAIRLIKSTVELAQQAVREYAEQTGDSNRKYIAASIGPYGASLADGSEYRGKYGVSRKTLLDYHESRFNALKDAGMDFYACETIPCAEEAILLAELLNKSKTPAWISFSCKDKAHICDGTPLVVLCRALLTQPHIFAIGINCSAPQHISPLIKIIRQECPDKKIVIYPNSGETYDANSKSWHRCETPIEYSHQAKSWLEEGAHIIGGCCQINPQHIKEMAKAIKTVSEPA